MTRLHQLLADSLRRLHRLVPAIERMDLRDRLPGITAPTPVIAGARPRHPAHTCRTNCRRHCWYAAGRPRSRWASPKHRAAGGVRRFGDRTPSGWDLAMTDQDRHANGMRIRREILGDEHVDRAVAGRHNSPSRFRTPHPPCPGRCLGAARLDRRTRSAVTLAVRPRCTVVTRSACMWPRRGATGSATTRSQRCSCIPGLRRTARRQRGIRHRPRRPGATTPPVRGEAVTCAGASSQLPLGRRPPHPPRTSAGRRGSCSSAVGGLRRRAERRGVGHRRGSTRRRLPLTPRSSRTPPWCTATCGDCPARCRAAPS